MGMIERFGKENTRKHTDFLHRQRALGSENIGLMTFLVALLSPTPRNPAPAANRPDPQEARPAGGELRSPVITRLAIAMQK